MTTDTERLDKKEEIAMEKQQQQQLHIVAVPFPAQSHISAMMHLCRRLSLEADVIISFVNIDSIHEQMKQHWIAPDTNIFLEPLQFDWKIPNGFDAYCVERNGIFADNAEKQLTVELHSLVLRLNTQVASVRCIVSDYFLPWTQQVADKLCIPRVALWSGCASWACIEYHLPELTARKHIFCKDSEDCLIDYIGGLSPTARSNLPLYLHRHNDQLWKEHGLKRSRGITEASLVLVNSFQALEKQAFEFMTKQLGGKFLSIGPLFLLGQSAENVLLRGEDVECISWLDTQKAGSVLYISFGSIAVLSREQYGELVQALTRIRLPFLWVIRPEFIVGGLPVEVHRDFCESFKEQGRVISWAPQLQVLKHKSVGGFLTHCGWNSMLESMTNGVPMVGWPWAGEQNTNCKLMSEEWKIGAGFSGSSRGGLIIQSDEIASVIRLVMEGGVELRRRAEEIKGECVKAVEQADKNVVAFLDQLRSCC